VKTGKLLFGHFFQLKPEKRRKNLIQRENNIQDIWKRGRKVEIIRKKKY
jgi:hypothetical protein